MSVSLKLSPHSRITPMHLPSLSPGKRFALPRPVGSADALLLAQLGVRDKANQQRVAIITADALDAQRLQDEMAFFAPDLRCVLFPDWETLPYDSFSPHPVSYTHLTLPTICSV